jgi:excisionase family DNA binding protein
MQDLNFSPLIEQLKTEISENVFNRIAPLIQSIPQPPQETELLTRKEAAKLLGVSLPTILDWTKTGKITGYRIASRIRYKRSELENSLLQIKTRK